MADHSSMRVANRAIVLAALKQTSPTSRSEIARVTGLAKPTVSTIIDDFLEHGVALDLGSGTSTEGGGRPPKLVGFNPKSTFVVGVHIGVHRTTIVLCDALGHEVDRWSGDTPSGPATSTLEHIAAHTRELVAGVPNAADALVGVGVCVPGLVRTEAGVCALAPNLGWVDVPVAETLRSLLDAPVEVRNTAQMCAMAEALEGAAVGSDHSVLLYAGTGIGAGIVADGDIFRGLDGMAGELGHCSIPGNDADCACGKTGCLETVTSGPAMAAHLGLSDDRPGGQIDRVVEAAVGGDAAAIAEVRAAADTLGWATAWLVNVVNPSTVVLGGGLADAGDLALEPFAAAVHRHSLAVSGDHVDVVSWKLGHGAKTRGAVLVALQAADGATPELLLRSAAHQ